MEGAVMRDCKHCNNTRKEVLFHTPGDRDCPFCVASGAPDDGTCQLCGGEMYVQTLFGFIRCYVCTPTQSP